MLVLTAGRATALHKPKNIMKATAMTQEKFRVLHNNFIPDANPRETLFSHGRVYIYNFTQKRVFCAMYDTKTEQFYFPAAESKFMIGTAIQDLDYYKGLNITLYPEIFTYEECKKMLLDTLLEKKPCNVQVIQ